MSPAAIGHPNSAIFPTAGLKIVSAICSIDCAVTLFTGTLTHTVLAVLPVQLLALRLQSISSLAITNSAPVSGQSALASGAADSYLWL